MPYFGINNAEDFSVVKLTLGQNAVKERSNAYIQNKTKIHGLAQIWADCPPPQEGKEKKTCKREDELD